MATVIRSATATLISRSGSIGEKDFDQHFQDIADVPFKSARHTKKRGACARDTEVESRLCETPLVLNQSGGVRFQTIDDEKLPSGPAGRLELLHILGSDGDRNFRALPLGNAEIIASVNHGGACHVMAHLPSDKDAVGVSFENKSGASLVAINHPGVPAIQSRSDFERWAKRKRMKLQT